MLARSATTLLSVLATAAVVALGAAAPDALRSLEISLPAQTTPHADEHTIVASVPTAPPTGVQPGGHAFAATEFHASWVSQSESAVLSGGQTATMRVSFRNTGTAPWIRGVLGQQANLAMSGEGAALASNWPSADRVAFQNESVVPPGGVGTFTFDVRGPNDAGSFRLDLRPVIDGTTWMEDEGVYLTVASRGIAAARNTIRLTLLDIAIAAFAMFVALTLFVVVRLAARSGRSRLVSAAGR
jgi:hypothetical protein